jgi:hypothetical protein
METGNKKWAPQETRNLISHFQDSPCLWDVFDKDYKNRYKKSTAVRKIALSFGINADEVKRKLHNLRRQYTHELKKTRIKKYGQGERERCKPQWPYFDALRFLEAVVNVRESTCNLLMQRGKTTNSGLDDYDDDDEIFQVGVV